MKKIWKIKRYSDFEIEAAIEIGICNWCGWQGWFNFSDFIEKIKSFENFDKNEFENLKKDLRRLCNEHDLDYFLQKWFYKSNLIFAFQVTRLIKSWTTFWEKIIVLFTLTFVLNKFWKKYYKKANEKINKEDYFLKLWYEI